MKYTAEQLQTARTASSWEELLKLAKEQKIEMTEDAAKEAFAGLHPNGGEVSDDELSAVAGGGCGNGKAQPQKFFPGDKFSLLDAPVHTCGSHYLVLEAAVWEKMYSYSSDGWVYYAVCPKCNARIKCEERYAIPPYRTEND